MRDVKVPEHNGPTGAAEGESNCPMPNEPLAKSVLASKPNRPLNVIEPVTHNVAIGWLKNNPNASQRAFQSLEGAD